MAEDNFALPEDKKEEAYIEEVYPQLDPDQVEKEMTEQFAEMQKNMPYQDVAAYHFGKYLPIYKKLIDDLYYKDAAQVAWHVVQWPAVDPKPTFITEKANQAFQVGTQLMRSKTIMLVHKELEHAQQMLEKQFELQEAAKAAENTNNTETPVETQGEANGEQV